MPKHPGYGDPRHHESDIARLNATITELMNERDELRRENLALIERLIDHENHHSDHHNLRTHGV